MKKKILVMALTLVTFLSFGVNCVNAKTIAITKPSDYYAVAGNTSIIDEDTTIILEDDIVLNHNDEGMQESLYVKHNLTLDLNGHTLTIHWMSLEAWFYKSNTYFMIIDSSEGHTGSIVKTGGYQSAIYGWQASGVTNNSIIIDGITYENNSGDAGNIGLSGSLTQEHTMIFEIRNSTFTINGWLLSFNNMYDTKDYWNCEIENTTILKASGDPQIGLAATDLKYNDLINTEKSKVYGDTTLLDNEDNVSYGREYNEIKIVNIPRLEVIAPNFEDASVGYDTFDARSIQIIAIGDDKDIESVTVSGTDFELNTVTLPISVTEGEVNTSFTIRPINDLSVGEHKATITVNGTYTAEVVFYVIQEILIANKTDWPTNFIIDTKTHYRLAGDVDLSEIASLEYTINNDLTIDLNGYDLTLGGNVFKFDYKGDYTVLFLNGSSNKSARIFKNDGEAGAFEITQDDNTVGTLSLGDIIYQNETGNYNDIKYPAINGKNKEFNFFFMNSTFKINGNLFDIKNFVSYVDYFKFYLENVTVEQSDYAKLSNNTVNFLSYPYKRYYTLIDTEKSDIYIDGELLEDTSTYIGEPYNKMEVKSKSRLEVTAPVYEEATEGYETIDFENILITALGENRTIESIELDNYDDFILYFDEHANKNVTVGSPNTEAKIKPADGLKKGIYKATITVIDNEYNRYKTTITFNVRYYAETQLVDNENDLRKFLESESRDFPEVKTVRLIDDIEISDWLGIYVLNGKTLDLNGFDLTTDDRISIVFGTDNTKSYNTGTFTIKGNDGAKTGSISSTLTDYSLFYISEQYYEDDAGKFAFNIDGGTYSSLYSSAQMFGFNFDNRWANDVGNKFNFNIKNATFNLKPVGHNMLIYANSNYITKDNFKISLEDIIVNLNGLNSKLMETSFYLTVDDIIPDTHQITYPQVENDEVIGTRIASPDDSVDSIKLDYIKEPDAMYQIKVEKKGGLKITAPTFDTETYGYDDVAAKEITIENDAEDEITIMDIKLNTTEFEIVGTGTPTIDAEGIDNTTFKIKPTTGLSAGIHNGTITIIDDESKIYMASVTFEVTKSDINPSISIDSWEYSDEAPTASINGNLGNGNVAYHYVGVSPTTYDSDVVPSDIGTYKVIATVEETTNYNGANCEDEFTISKKIVTLDNTKVIFNNKVFNGDTLPNYSIDDALNVPSEVYSYEIKYTYDGGKAREQAGTYKVKVEFTIWPSYQDKYEFEGGETTILSEEKTYQITTLTPTVVDNSGGNAEVARGNTLDLSQLVSVEYPMEGITDLDKYAIKQDLEYELAVANDKVIISGRNLVVEEDATLQTIKVIVTSPAQKLWPTSDLNEFAETQIQIDVEIVDKPSQTFNKEAATKNMTYKDTLSNPYEVTNSNGGVVTYTSSNSDYVEVDENGTLTAKKATTSPVTITVTAAPTEDYAMTTLTYQVNVAKKSVTVSAGNYEVNKQYDKTTNPGTATGSLAIEGIFESDTEVSIIPTIGSYTSADYHAESITINLALTGSGSENYDLANTTVSVPGAILSKLVTPTIEVSGIYSYTGSAITPTITIKDGDDVIPTSEYVVSYEKNINAGEEAKIIVSANPNVDERNFNYEITSVTKNFTINKAIYTGTITSIEKTVGENRVDTYEINLGDLNLPSAIKNATIKDVDKTGAIINTVSHTDNKVTFTTTSVAANTTGEIVLTIENQNYNDITLTVEVVAVAKTNVVISGLTFANKAFDNYPIAPSGSLITTPNYDGILEIKYVGQDVTYNSSEAPKDVGTYTVTYKVPDSNLDYIGSETWTFTISKADANYTLPTGLKGIVGNELSSVTLPDGFSWKTPTTILEAGNKTYLATYTPEDTNNYNVMNDISVNVYVKDKFDVTTLVEGANGSISANLLEVIEGTEKEITFTPNTGYMIDKVFVDDVNKTSDVAGNKLLLIVNKDLTVKVSYKKIPFVLTINEVTGADIDPTGSINIEYGDSKVVTISVVHGYKLISIKVNDTDKTDDLSSEGKLTLNNITEDANVVVVVQKIQYEVIEGNNLKTKDLSKLSFRFDADYNLFEDGGQVFIDGTLLESANYTSKEGSTIITLNEDYAKTLSKDKHTIKVVFNDGGEAETDFTIVDPSTNPETKDNILTYIIMFIVSTIGIGTAAIFGKKKIRTQR